MKVDAARAFLRIFQRQAVWLVIYIPNVLDNLANSVGFIGFATEFKCLGSIAHHSLISFAQVDERISSASAAFGSLKITFTYKDIDLQVKEGIYIALCISILLYGSKSWCLREDLFNRLHHFQHRCARIMCRIAIAHTIRHRTSSTRLIKRLAIKPFDTNFVIVNLFDGQAMSPGCPPPV
jgi:hypothetical protein